MGSAPRTRGDGPKKGFGKVAEEHLLPTSAGMGPTPTSMAASLHPVPCARRDGPDGVGVDPDTKPCSPRLRGWFMYFEFTGVLQDLLPAPAGMVSRATSVL